MQHDLSYVENGTRIKITWDGYYTSMQKNGPERNYIIVYL